MAKASNKKRRVRHYSVLLTILLLTGFIAGTGLWLRAQRRQYALNRQLIAALKQENDRRALALVNAGADPNTLVDVPPVPSLWGILKQMFHRPVPSVIQQLTAFTLACGWRLSWWEGDKKVIVKCPENVDLVQAMIAHGAQMETSAAHVAKGEEPNEASLFSICPDFSSVSGASLDCSGAGRATTPDAIGT